MREVEPEPPKAPVKAVATQNTNKCQAIANEIAKYDGWDHRTMLAIAKAENRTCDPTRHNLTNSERHNGCTGSYGALQVGCVHYKPEQDRDSLATNVAIAHRVWQDQGYNAWTQYSNNKYREFL